MTKLKTIQSDLRMRIVHKLLESDEVNIFNIETYMKEHFSLSSDFEKKEIVKLYKHVWEECADNSSYRTIFNKAYA